MTPKERVLACCAGKDSDRAAVLNPVSVATVESMKACGASFPDVHTDADKMSALAATGHDILGFDTVSPYFSVCQEAAALGCTIDWGEIDVMPTVRSSVYKRPEDFKMPKDFLDKPAIKCVLTSIKQLKKKYKDVAVAGKVMGPWTLSYHLHGTQEFLMETIMEPDIVLGFLDAFKTISLTFAEAQFEAGADVLTWADHATGDMVSAEGYEKFLLPIHQACNKELNKMGPVILHTCGRTIDRIKLFAQTGFEVFHIDSKNDIYEAMNLVEGKIKLTGHINNPKTLLFGSTEDVKAEVATALDAGVRLISPECAIPCRVQNKNLKAIVEAVLESESYRK